MTLKKFFVFLILQWVILAFVKLWFFNYPIFANAGLQQVIFCAISTVLGAALVRRLGVVSLFEVSFIAVCWVIVDLILDFFVVAVYTGYSIFHRPEYWFGILFLALSAMICHKKRHLHIRHELHAKQHAHSHHDHENKDHKH